MDPFQVFKKSGGLLVRPPIPKRAEESTDRRTVKS